MTSTLAHLTRLSDTILLLKCPTFNDRFSYLFWKIIYLAPLHIIRGVSALAIAILKAFENRNIISSKTLVDIPARQPIHHSAPRLLVTKLNRRYYNIKIRYHPTGLPRRVVSI